MHLTVKASSSCSELSFKLLLGSSEHQDGILLLMGLNCRPELVSFLPHVDQLSSVLWTLQRPSISSSSSYSNNHNNNNTLESPLLRLLHPPPQPLKSAPDGHTEAPQPSPSSVSSFSSGQLDH